MTSASEACWSSRGGIAIRDDDQTVGFNVRGKLFSTRRSTLCKFEGHYLADLVMSKGPDVPNFDVEGRYKLDFDPILFRRVLNALRTLDNTPGFPMPPICLPPDLEVPFSRLVNRLGLTRLFCSSPSVGLPGGCTSPVRAAVPDPQSHPATTNLLESAGALIGSWAGSTLSAMASVSHLSVAQSRSVAAGVASAADPSWLVAQVPWTGLNERGSPARSRTDGEITSGSGQNTSNVVANARAAAGVDQRQPPAQEQSAAPTAGNRSMSTEQSSLVAEISDISEPNGGNVNELLAESAAELEWSGVVRHNLVSVCLENTRNVSIADSRSQATSAAVRTTLGFGSGVRRWKIAVNICSDWSYVGFVSAHWSGLTIPVGRGPCSWGVASNGVAYAARREVDRLRPFTVGSLISFRADFAKRAVDVNIDGDLFPDVFCNVPASIFPAVSNCRSAAAYSLELDGGDVHASIEEVAKPHVCAFERSLADCASNSDLSLSERLGSSATIQVSVARDRAGTPPFSGGRGPRFEWSKMMAHQCVTVDPSNPSVASVADTRSLACAAAVRASSALEPDKNEWHVVVDCCSNWSYVGFVAAEWQGLSCPIGRAPLSWGLASNGTAYACEREVARLNAFKAGNTVKFHCDTQQRAVRVAIDDGEYHLIFCGLPPILYPAASNCRSAARYTLV